METTKEFFSEKNEYEAIIEDHNFCCLCGTRLDFRHKVDYETLTVNEEAQCPSCRVPHKPREYVLQ
jgi:nitrate/TMAO reductase-like tetraheme cytochrome c subunit